MNDPADLEQLQQEDALFPWLADGSIDEPNPHDHFLPDIFAGEQVDFEPENDQGE